MKVQNKVIRFTILTSLIILLFSVSGYCENPKELIIGQWQKIDDSTNIIEYFEDGTFLMKCRANTMFANMTNLFGNWQIIDNGKIRIEFNKLGILHNARVAKLEFKDNEMIITYDEGQVSIRRRLNHHLDLIVK
ncbi:MAG: hypothetical protein HQ554_04850 [FCB group bacterium]|nr:hypothetical protein [FCB group bacterium]